jgi:hypothetical protein
MSVLPPGADIFMTGRFAPEAALDHAIGASKVPADIGRHQQLQARRIKIVNLVLKVMRAPDYPTMQRFPFAVRQHPEKSLCSFT